MKLLKKETTAMTNDNQYSYTQAVARLEEILQTIQSGNVEIDTLYRLLKEADELIKLCRTRLYEVDEEVKILLDSMNEETL